MIQVSGPGFTLLLTNTPARVQVGDVLLTYENEVVLTNQVYGPEKALDCIRPQPNIRIECPIALVDRVIQSKSARAQVCSGAHSPAASRSGTWPAGLTCSSR